MPEGPPDMRPFLHADAILDAACNWLASHPRITAALLIGWVVLAGNMEGTF